MEIRPTTEQDLDVFVDTLHAAFGRFPETPTENGGVWSALEMDRNLLALAADGGPSVPPVRTPSNSPCPVRSSFRPQE